MIEWTALGQVALAGVILGAGIPALFALGTLMLSNEDSDGNPVVVTAGRKAIAYVCFGICVAAVIVGVVFLAAGGHS